ncbi:MAG: hypothetical protein E7577_04590 [Ruminococcaceae bacterium]|nr:hypothetical protein [Oscillospiraceae bacterium]
MRMNEQATVQDNGAYVIKKSKKSSVIAFIVCVVVAFLIWSYAEAVSLKEEKDKAALGGDNAVTENTEAAQSANE